MKTLFATENITVKIANRFICQNLNWKIGAHERWGVLGPNGSGKTTLLHTLAKLKVPESGNIMLDGNNMRQIAPKDIAKKLGILLQETQCVFPQTVFDYCLAARYPYTSSFTASEDQKITEEALNIMALLPLRKQSVMTLSGGERRRLAFAALLTQAPSVYLLDEPFNHLDIKHQVTMLHHLKKLSDEGAAMITTLHDINLAREFCSHLLLVSGDGEVQFGTTDDILTMENLSRLYQIDFECRQKAFWIPQ